MFGRELTSLAVIGIMIASAAVVALTACSGGVEAYVPHDLIEIDGNTDFAETALAESWPGNGTESNPYVLDSLEIDADWAGHAISITNTDVHFVISNGHFLDCDGSAIYLYNVENAHVHNNTFTSCPFYSIYAESSERLSVSNNTIDGGSHCMGFGYYTTTVSLENNTVTGAGWWPLVLFGATYVTMRGNSFEGSCIGIFSNLPGWTTLDIDVSNTVNGAPIRYFKDCVGEDVPSYAGQVILANCTDMLVQGVGKDGTSSAITVGYSSMITVRDCVVSDVHQGVTFWFVTNCTVESVWAEDARRSGIEVWNSANCSIENSTITGCGYGLWIQDSGRTSVSNNTVSESMYIGIYLNYAWSSEVTGNLVSSGLSKGLDMFWSESNIVTLNSFVSNDGYAVYAGSHSTGNWIFNNSFVENHGSSDVYNPAAIQAFDMETGSNWNNSDEPKRGNYWHDWTSPDDDQDWIVDDPYPVGSTYDYYPLAYPPTDIPCDIPEDVRVSLTLDRTAYMPGEDIGFSVSVVNDGDTPAQLLFPTSQILDFHVEDSDGTVVFDFSPDVSQVYTVLELGPYEEYSEDLTWEQSSEPAPYPAEYTVHAYPANELLLVMSANGTFTIEMEAPVSEVVLSGDEGEAGWFVSDVSVEISATDAWSGVALTEYRLAGSDWQAYSDSFEISDDGNHTLEWRSTDYAGNVEDVQSVEVKVDCGLPELEVLTSNGTVFDNESVEIDMLCSDAVSGIASVEYSLDDGGFEESADHETISLSGLTEGNHSLEVLVRDAAGNSVTVVLTFEVQISGDDGTEPSSDDDDGLPIVLALAVVGVAVIALVAMLMRRRNAKGPEV